MSTYEEQWPADPDPFWEQERVNEREDWDDHLRHVEDDERELQLRGEAA